MLSRGGWAVDDATRGGGGRREASSSLRRTTKMDGIFPRRRRDGNGWPDAWACDNVSTSRRDASELEALWRWRGLEI